MALSENDFFARINAINKRVDGTPTNQKNVALPPQRELSDSGWDDPYLDSMQTTDTKDIQSAPVVSEAAAMRSHLPDAIKQSMLSEQIDTSKLERSGADELMMSGHFDRIKELTGTKKKETAINEAKTVPTQGIDYSVLKDIINGCLDAKLESYLGTLTTIGLKNGTIRLVDHKGNIYEAKLKKVGNTND